MSFTVVTTINLLVGLTAGGRTQTLKFDRANAQPTGQAAPAKWATVPCSVAGCITPNLSRITRRSSQFSNNLQLKTTWNGSFQSSTNRSSRSLKTERQHPRNLNHGIRPLNLRFLPQLALTS